MPVAGSGEYLHAARRKIKPIRLVTSVPTLGRRRYLNRPSVLVPDGQLVAVSNRAVIRLRVSKSAPSLKREFISPTFQRPPWRRQLQPGSGRDSMGPASIGYPPDACRKVSPYLVGASLRGGRSWRSPGDLQFTGSSRHTSSRAAPLRRHRHDRSIRLSLKADMGAHGFSPVTLQRNRGTRSCKNLGCLG